MTIPKAIKKSILGYLILCGVLVFANTIQAASIAPPDAQESYDYTLQNHSDQVSPIEEEAYLDIEEMPRELTIIMQAASKDHNDVPQLLAMVAENVQNRQYYKYLFASSGLITASQAQQKAHNLNYHLVKAPAGPVIWQVLSFLDQKSYLEIKGLILPEDAQLCLPCGHMAMHLFGKKLPVHKTGCQRQPFPTTAAPASAIACFYSDLFTDQQQRLVISQIGEKAFPDPKKLITPPLAHDHDKPTFQPIQPFSTKNQLHMAVQLHFPIDAIKVLLTSLGVRINTLDSTGKTPLDYATQGSNIYSLLVGHDAKTSQQLKQLQAAVPSPAADDIASYHSEEDQAATHKTAAAAPLPPGQLLIPANGQCLYTTVIMGYLLPVRKEADILTARIDQLFGMQPARYINELYQTLEDPTHYLAYLHSDAFGGLATAFMARMKIKKGTWGGPREIQTIADKLRVSIQAYYPDPSNPTNLVQSDLTKPVEVNAAITLHIVRDKVHPAEVLTQTQKASAKDNPHYQHYRLKYTFPSSIPAPAIGGHLSHSPSNIHHKPAIPAVKLIPITPAEANNHAFDGKKEATPPISPEQSPSPSDHSAPSQRANNHLEDSRYTISNPLVLLTCAVEYAKNASLPTVKEEMETLYDLFKRKCGYKVVSTVFDEAGNIFPRHKEDEKEMDGKWLYKSKLITWINRQVNYLQQYGKKYDALIFIFSGHGVRDGKGRECIATSDDKFYLWQHIEAAFAPHPAFQDNFKHKPKLFFKLACRSPSQSVINEKNLPVDKNKVFTFYPTAAKRSSDVYEAQLLTKFMFRYFQLAIHEKHPLSWIAQMLKQEISKLHGYENIPDTVGKLSIQHVFFDKQGSRTFFSLPATNNLPKLPHHDGHMMHREEDLKDIFDNFLSGHTQQVLIAAGGLGKSTLACLYATKYLAEDHYVHVWWFNAEDEATLAASIAAVNQEMGIEANDYLNMQQGMDKIKEKLQTCPNWLLIFDNAKLPDKLLKDYLPKDTTRGHVLITSRRSQIPAWTKHKIFPHIVAGLAFREAKSFLRRFHMPENIEEGAALGQLLNSLHLLPLALAQIGHYLYQDRQDRYHDKKTIDTIYQNYFTFYKEEQESYNANDSSISRSIVISLTITQKRIEEKIKQGDQKETIHLKEIWPTLLQVISFLHPDGLDQMIFAHLHLSRKDKGATIGDKQAKETVKYLCKYGILIEEKGKYRIHRTIQEIMRWRIAKKQLTPYIQGQALQLLETMQQQSPKQVALLHFEMAAHCRTLMGHVKSDTKKRIRLLRLMSQIDSHAYLRTQLYLPPQATNHQSLHTQVIQFVNGTTPLLLLTADAGIGKSTYGCYLVEMLWKMYQNKKAYIPFFISLPAYCTKGAPLPTDLVTKALRSKGLDDTTISKMQQAAKDSQQPWVFVLDGYDEIYGACNLFEACQLSHWGTKQSKYIITCRTQYVEVLRQQGKATENLFTAGKRKAKALSIAPFSPAQVEKYIEEFAKSDYNLYKKQIEHKEEEKKEQEKDKRKFWDNARYQQALAKSPHLKAWMTTPFLLVIGLQALPSLYGKDDPQKVEKTITKVDICKAFIEAWMARELKKPQMHITQEALCTFCEELAYALAMAEKQVIKKHDPEMQAFFDRAIQLQSAPLRHIAEVPGSYQFIHPDFQGYFAASFIVKNIAKNKLPPNLPSVNPNMKAFLLHYKDTTWHYLQHIQQGPSIATSNSVQILYWAGHRDFRKAHLAQLDLRGINLTQANLPKNLSNTNLRGATLPKDLSGINLTQAKLPQDLSKHNLTHANLSNTDLTNIKLPEDLSGINFTDAKLPQDLSNRNLTYANLSNTDLTYVKLPEDLSHVNFIGAQLPQDLSRYNFTHTNLSNTDLPKNLSGVNFTKTKLPQDLSKHNLTRTNLSNTNLKNVKLPKDLSGINFTDAKLPKDLSKHNLTHTNLSNTNLTNVKLPEDLSGINFTDAKLPKDLSNHNFTHANLTSHRFTSTNFAGTQLEGVMLTNTLCNYQQCFQDHIKANKLSGGSWYQANLPKDLKSIAQVYSRLSQHKHKAELLQIASGLAYLPYWEDTEFYIKVYYWSCKLLLLKKKLSGDLGEQLGCGLAFSIESDVKYACWQTDYPQHQVDEEKKAPHHNFNQYLKTFHAGLQQYNCRSMYSWAYDWYKTNIEKNIQGVQKTYPQLITPKLQQEAVDIAFQLSTLYQHQHLPFLLRYLSLQNRLIRFKISVGLKVGNTVHYHLSYVSYGQLPLLQ